MLARALPVLLLLVLASSIVLRLSLAPLDVRQTGQTLLLGTSAAMTFLIGVLQRSPRVAGENPLNRGGRFLEPLPLSAGAVLVVTLALLFPAHLVFASVHAALSGWRSGLFSILVTNVSVIAGFSLMTARRALTPRTIPRRAGAIAGALFRVVSGVAFVVPSLASSRAMLRLAAPVRTLAPAPSTFAVAVVALTVPVWLAIYLAGERWGFDRQELVTLSRIKRAHGPLGVARLDRILNQRTPGLRVLDLFSALVVLSCAGLLVIFPRAPLPGLPPGDWRGSIAGFSAYMLIMQSAGRSLRASVRDRAARPLLSSLPLSPTAVLDTRTRAEALRAVLFASPVVLALGAHAARTGHYESALAACSLVAALVLGAAAVTTLGVLNSAGAGGLGPARGMGFEIMLVLAPVLSAARAASALDALVSLGLLAVVAFESHRVAAATTRWSEDGDAFDRATPLWRALLIAAAFFVIPRFIGAVFSGLPGSVGLKNSIALLVASFLAYILARYDREMPVAPLRSTTRDDVLLGVAGALTTAFAVLAFPSGTNTWGHVGTLELIVGTLAIVVVAPLSQEYFFRGTLLEAILSSHPRLHGWGAVALSATLFAALWPVAIGPRLVLGMVSGALYMRTERRLGASLIAHLGYAAGSLALWLMQS
jgi:Type II CAAX prenyl endopeptidase Rce1-like